MEMSRHKALSTWIFLNEYIIDADEETCKVLLEEEISGRGRKSFIRRIHSRLNRVRADKERKKLGIHDETSNN